MPILTKLLLSLWGLLAPGVALQAGFFFGSNYTASTGCTTPTGSNLTESFGDNGTNSCGTWNTTGGCNNQWTVDAGTGESIAASPSGASANTACANSLKMVLGATQTDIDLNFTGISGAFDVQGTFYATGGPANGDDNTVICVTASAGTCDIAGAIVGLRIGNSGACASNCFLEGLGTANSVGTEPISLNTWYSWKLHRDTVAANCYFTVNGGTQHTFTCNTGTAATVYVGPEHYQSDTSTTFYIGNFNL